MSFSRALELLRTGHKLTRMGWNGANQYIVFIPETDHTYTNGMDHEPYFVIKTVRDTVGIWVPSTSDLLALDWMLVN